MDTMNDELWRVQLSTGEIRMMTIDALDRAFDEGLIDARVPVLPPGASAWTTLGEAAGLEDDCPTEQTPSLSPFAISSSAPSSDVVSSAPESKPTTDELDLPDSFDELAPRRKRGLVIGGAAGALAVAAAVAVLAGRLGASAPVAADVKAAAAVEAPPPAAVETLPPPVAKEADAKPELSDWQKRMLADADKAREEKARAKSQERAPKQQPKPKQPSRSNGLLNGGDKFDPLNGAL